MGGGHILFCIYNNKEMTYIEYIYIPPVDDVVDLIMYRYRVGKYGDKCK